MIEKIKTIVAQELGLNEPAVTGSMKFSECGMDSLDFATMITAIEIEFKVQIPDDKWVVIDTPLDLLREVEAAHAAVSA